MKTEIIKEEWVKKVHDSFEVELPEVNLFFWHNGIRKAYAVFPKWSTWNKEAYNKPEEIYEYQVISVDPTNKVIEAFTLSVSSLSEMLKESNKHYRLVDQLLFHPNEDRRTEEQFRVDYDNVVMYFNDILCTKKVEP